VRWLALLRTAPGTSPAPRWPEALVWWALQFTPRVARLEEALVLELSASLRLFKGRTALQQRLLTELNELLGAGNAVLAWAPNSQAALALARTGAPGDILDGCPEHTPLAALLDRLPFPVLSHANAHAPLLARLGCRVLADLRRLPRAALARRTTPQLLRQLDHAYGQLGSAAEAHDWCVAPEQFEAKRELPQRTDDAALLQHHAEPLLRAACLWLGARHAGSHHIDFGWQYDSLRARSLGPGGSLRLSSGEAHRSLRVWQRLLTEHLNRLQLEAPVSDLWLRIDEAEPLQETSSSLLAAGPDAQAADGESLNQLLQRLSVRLGPEQVQQAQPVADHRPEHQQRWQAWSASKPAPELPPPDPPAQWPQPSWLLNPPLQLACLREQPLYQGPLTLLAGPQRVESGWWDEAGTAARRDYFLAHSRQAGLLWLFRERQRNDANGWFLHGLFA
jgi:protein ImuB